MYVKVMPKSSNKNPMSLREFFSNSNNRVYPIKSDLQRRYCWTDNEVDNFVEQYYIDMFDKNIYADKNDEDTVYGTIGDGIICKEETNWKNTGCPYNELVDMSQRILTSYAICVVSLKLYMDQNNIFDIEERRNILDTYLKTKNRKCLKIETTFEDCEIKSVYEKIVLNTFTFTNKELKNACNLFKGNKDKESVYKPFSQLVHKVYATITNSIELEEDFKLRLDSFLDKTFIQVEECNIAERVEKFREVNSYRVGVADIDIFKTLLCDKGKRIDEKYQEFEASVKKISSNVDNCKKRINVLKAKYTNSEYIMKLALIYLTKDKDICRYDFKLTDTEKGIEWQIKNENGVLRNEEEILTFLNICIDISNFLYDSIEPHKKYNECWYMFTEGRNTSVIWLYNILPCYVISKIKDEKSKNYAFDMLLKSYVIYSIKYLDNRSVQYIQNYMYTFAMKVILFETQGYDMLKIELNEHYSTTFGSFLSKNFSDNISYISYEGSSSQGAIRGILSTIEFLAQRNAGIIKDNIYKFTTSKKNGIDIEHIMPHSLKNDDNSVFINGIGNLTLLESSLNSSKGDNSKVTSERYNDTSFITTKLINEKSRYEGLTNAELDDIRNNNIPYTCTEETLNNFNIDDIRLRKNKILKVLKDFLQTE